MLKNRVMLQLTHLESANYTYGRFLNLRSRFKDKYWKNLFNSLLKKIGLNLNIE